MTQIIDRIQGLSGSLAFKVPVQAATIGNIILNGLQTVDGVALAAGDRVLVRAQTDAVDNGVYDVATSDWQRSLDFNGAGDVAEGTLVNVIGGDTNYGLWILDAKNPIVGTSPLTFNRFGGFEDADHVVYTPSGVGAVVTTVQTKLRESVSPKDFGAVGDDTEECTAAFQAAIDAVLAAGGGKIYIPAGTYWFPAGTKLDPGVGGITFVGDGPDSTVLHYNEGTTFPAHLGTEHLFRNITDTAKKTLVFENLQIRGTLDTRAGRWANPMWLDFYPSIQIRNCKFYDIAGEAMDLHKNDHALITGCTFENIAADAIRIRDTPNCIITDNYILRNGDDAIAIHTSDGYAPIREGVYIGGNRLVNCGAIKALGGRVMQIVNNTLELPNLWGIVVSNDSGNPEGNVPLRDIVIANNIILDLVSITSAVPATTSIALEVAGIVPRGVASTNNTIPGRYNTTTGSFIYPWDYDELDVDDASNPVGFIHGVSITGNVVRRSRPAVASFSDYGHGTRLWQGVAYDPAITDANLRIQNGLKLRGGIANAVIDGNTIESATYGVEVTAPATNYQYTGVIFSNNGLFDCSSRGFLLNSAAFSQDITITGNNIECDPYRVGSNSNTDGTYSADSTPRGIDLGDVGGITITLNKFSNVCKAVSSNTTKNILRGNVLSCLPVATATGFTNTNKGIGFLEPACEAYLYEIIDADPTSATYGAVSLGQLSERSGMPTAGVYVRGAFVKNTSPSLDANNMSVLGWLRLTTGSGHVSGTDWAVIRGSHVSPAT